MIRNTSPPVASYDGNPTENLVPMIPTISKLETFLLCCRKV